MRRIVVSFSSIVAVAVATFDQNGGSQNAFNGYTWTWRAGWSTAPVRPSCSRSTVTTPTQTSASAKVTKWSSRSTLVHREAK